MSPTLPAGKLILASGFYGVLRPTDIVVFRHDGLDKIKRVQKIEADRLYVVGDSTTQSTDSRDFGWIDVTSVLAKLVWPKESL